jgi:hypothetical protein
MLLVTSWRHVVRSLPTWGPSVTGYILGGPSIISCLLEPVCHWLPLGARLSLVTSWAHLALVTSWWPFNSWLPSGDPTVIGYLMAALLSLVTSWGPAQ